MWLFRYANNPFMFLIHILTFHCFLVTALVGYFTLLYSYHFKIVLYPFEYGLVVIVGFMFLYLLHTQVDMPCN